MHGLFNDSVATVPYAPSRLDALSVYFEFPTVRVQLRFCQKQKQRQTRLRKIIS